MSENVQVATSGEILRKFTRELPVALLDPELQTYGKMLAEKCKEQELALEKKKQVTADHNNRIKVITNEIKRIADARAKGEELRPVMCGERIKGNVIEIVRLDSGAVVDSRPAEMRDLQTTLPGTDIPEGFDVGPRGDGLGSLADQPVEPPGEMQTSSAGDAVFVGNGENEADLDEPNDDAPQLTIVRDDASPALCEECGTELKPGEMVAELDGATIHADCMPGDKTPETEDEMVDRMLAERESTRDDGDFGGALARKEAAAKAKAEAEAAEKPKAKRERSAKKNGTKKKK